MKDWCVCSSKTRLVLSFKCFSAKKVFRHHQGLFQEYQLPINFSFNETYKSYHQTFSIMGIKWKIHHVFSKTIGSNSKLLNKTGNGRLSQSGS